MKKYVVEYLDNGINYTIKTFFDFTMAVDLSAYANELKKAIIKVLIDKFF